ncbi:four helix bundle protein [Pontibacter sp. BT310]|uniref:Four helix bundle protein n=1 Tax=Pontibacter populi TaxID=890055 RepID=A0ABS6XE66_9BACT|nr:MULTISPECIES: four helix bundle protein [Pontibacter]MBJ6119431.1 four helix bundle protein [Pontibacter sp. BT310]MBR0571859.1 four helix bundle protein [Microvirga sp. STS03]MBW3366285.1 four helix bundle protein [Pontibacter populi]
MVDVRIRNFDFGEQFKKRTKTFALRVIKLFQSLPKNDEAQIIGKQLLRSATSVAANYRATCRARSKAEFVAKIGVVLEEADESLFWLEILEEAEIIKPNLLAALKQEAFELTAILATIRKNAAKK